MRLGERVELIKKLARTLSGRGWADIDLVLRQAGLPTTERWEPDDRYGYCIWSIERATDGTLLELDEYLHSTTDSTPKDEPWTPGMFRVFITHTSGHKIEATDLKRYLAWFGIDGFVAHEDIEPTRPWQRVIEAALRSCDALVALLHDGFRESNWCDQEVGFVLGRSQPVIPVSFDLQPYGFFGSLQSIRGGPLTSMGLAAEVSRVLLGDPRSGQHLTERMVNALAESTSFNQSNLVVRVLADHAPLVTVDQLARLRVAQKANIDLTQAFDVDDNLRKIEQRFGISVPTPPAPVAYDEEPF